MEHITNNELESGSALRDIESFKSLMAEYIQQDAEFSAAFLNAQSNLERQIKAACPGVELHRIPEWQAFIGGLRAEDVLDPYQEDDNNRQEVIAYISSFIEMMESDDLTDAE